jgi:hypothetical protein
VGSLLLRAAAFAWLVFAGVGLLLAGQGDQSPCAPTAFAALGAGCWAAGHMLHRARRGRWATPMAARMYACRADTATHRRPKRGLAPACPATPDARGWPAAGAARRAARRAPGLLRTPASSAARLVVVEIVFRPAEAGHVAAHGAR